MNSRFFVIALTLGFPTIASAQATDPVAVGQIMTQRGTAEGYAERGRDRQRGERTRPALSDDCAKMWKLRDRMTRAEKRKLYDLCPR